MVGKLCSKYNGEPSDRSEVCLSLRLILLETIPLTFRHQRGNGLLRLVRITFRTNVWWSMFAS